MINPLSIRPKVMQKRLKLAQCLADANEGKLPNPWKMIQQGYGGLYRYIQRHPKEFSHFEVEKAVGKEKNAGRRSNFNVSIRNEHLKKAQQLAQKNNGVLQNIGWLIQHGHTRLASYVKTYPYIFIKLQEPLPPKVQEMHKQKSRRY